MHHIIKKKFFFHRLTIYTLMPYLRFHCSIHTHIDLPQSPCSSMFFSGEKNSAYQPYNTQSKNQIKNYRTESKVFHEREREKETLNKLRGKTEDRFLYIQNTHTDRWASLERTQIRKTSLTNSIHHHTFERKKSSTSDKPEEEEEKTNKNWAKAGQA